MGSRQRSSWRLSEPVSAPAGRRSLHVIGDMPGVEGLWVARGSLDSLDGRPAGRRKPLGGDAAASPGWAGPQFGASRPGAAAAPPGNHETPPTPHHMRDAGGVVMGAELPSGNLGRASGLPGLG